MSQEKTSKFAQTCIFDRPVNNFGLGHANNIMMMMMMMIMLMIMMMKIMMMMMMIMMIMMIIIIIIICYKEAKGKTRILFCNIRTYYTTSPDNITSHNVSSTLTLYVNYQLDALIIIYS